MRSSSRSHLRVAGGVLGKTAGEILAIDGEVELGRLDLAAHLSPTRKNGLAMVQRVRELAAAAQEATP